MQISRKECEKFKMAINFDYDFSGWATKANVKCFDGLTIAPNAFKDCDGKVVPVVWNHDHSAPESVLGHALLQNRKEGVYAYTDDMHLIHRSKEVLLKVLEGVKTIAAEYGLILNEKKTRICKLSGEYRYLQMKYTLLQNGVVVRRIHPKAITRERRKLKAYKRLLDKGVVTIEEIDGYFRSWLSGNYKYMSRDQIYDVNSLYVKLFGRSVTWKKGHGRLHWLMAHPSAA